MQSGWLQIVLLEVYPLSISNPANSTFKNYNTYMKLETIEKLYQVFPEYYS